MSNFKISIIIPIYNVENYLEQTLKSVINQSIGIKNIQLILINDGSTDNSENICLKYKEKYPQNILYYKQKNSGVSAARNKGIELAKGELTNFLDSDDLLSKNALEIIYKAYQKNPEINIFSFRMNFFDAKQGAHPLNYKYKEDKIINILEEYDFPQLSSSSTVIKTSILKKYKFDSDIKYSEDNKLINEILFDNEKIMMLKKPVYYYRKRKNHTSAVNGSITNKDWYLVTPQKVYKYLFELSEKKFGKVINYIQNLIAYEISWRIFLPENPLNKEEFVQYKDTMEYLISRIGSKIIINHQSLSFNQKMYLLMKKNDKKGVKEYKEEKKKVFSFVIDQIYYRNNKLDFYCRINEDEAKFDAIEVFINDKKINTQKYIIPTDCDEKSFEGEKVGNTIGINFQVPVKSQTKISFQYKGNKIKPRFSVIAFLTERLPHSYHHLNKKLTITRKKEEIIIERKNIIKLLKYEISNCKSLLKKKNYKLLLARITTKLIRTFKFKDIWIISDRLDAAGDNGEHFFEYMMQNHSKNKIYFVLSSNSKDYKRMSKIGKVIDPKSNKYKLIFHASDYVVSSQANGFTYNPLGTNGYYITDQHYFKFVFLQHGIIKDDLSPWLNANVKRMDMFVTSTMAEYDSLLKEKYYFGPSIVKLTGLPRFDKLLEDNNKPAKTILVSFTWRSNLASLSDPQTGEKIYNPEFKESNYFKKLNELVESKKICTLLKKYNYKIRFCPHPNVLVQMEDFKFNDLVEIVEEPINYQKEFKRNALLITDCSSVFFDFGYLKKPIIYYQFDIEEFYKHQIYNKGYFDYKKDGFGEVCSSIDEIATVLEEYLKNDCKLEEKYEKVINETFKYHDVKNCQRVYDEIKKL